MMFRILASTFVSSAFGSDDESLMLLQKHAHLRSNLSMPTFCGNEGEQCTCSGLVVYGKRYFSGKPGAGAENGPIGLTQGPFRGKVVDGSVTCGSDTFSGDPASGYHKYCYCFNPVVNVGPYGCADEGKSCECTGDVFYTQRYKTADAQPGQSEDTRDINPGGKMQSDVIGSITCDSATFGGDPFHGWHKSCFCSPKPDLTSTAAPTTTAYTTTPAPTTAAPTTAAPEPGAVDDPHITAVSGHKFDVYKAGDHDFLVIPEGATPANAKLHISGKVRKFGERDNDLWIRKLKVQGKWVRDGPYEFKTSNSAFDSPESALFRTGGSKAWKALGKAQQNSNLHLVAHVDAKSPELDFAESVSRKLELKAGPVKVLVNWATSQKNGEDVNHLDLHVQGLHADHKTTMGGLLAGKMSALQK